MSQSLRDGRWVAVFLVGICVMWPSEIAAQERPPGKLDTTKLETSLKRRKPTTEEELRRQLLDFPEAGFDQQAAKELYVPIVTTMTANPPLKQLPTDRGMTYLQEKALQDKRPEMVFLPWLLGPDNLLIKEDAEHLQTLSLKLRIAFRDSAKREDEGPPDADKLRTLLAAPVWTTPVALPTITQMMQAEPTAVRLLLVELLAKIEGKEASVALAKRAIFDLSPGVRSRAVRALATRPAVEYTPVLYDGFRYPWPAAADHAAEAVAELKRVDMIPELVKLLKEPSPTLPVKAGEGYTVQEVVRINHLCNCMLCHAPSLEKDNMVRRSVPIPGERIVVYYDRSGTLFVRADLTYLRQDFSVVQPVAKPGKWPADQRYDYLVRTRPLSKTEQEDFQKLEKEGKILKSYLQQAAVVFALQELTGEDHGTTYESWSTGLQKSRTSPPKARGTE
jgi:hypothetical protein